MTTRLVCRSAPLPTKHLAKALAIDAAIVERLADGELVFVGLGGYRTLRRVLASPSDTDNARCWSEEIFSELEAGR